MIDRFRGFLYRVLRKIQSPAIHACEKQADGLRKQMERIEDRIARIESGLEASGHISKESRLKVRHLDLHTLSPSEAFDYIYEHRLWAEDPSMLSGPGSYGPWAEQFVALLKTYIAENKVRTIVDIGCGDFNIGSQLCPLVEKYHALDISNKIININLERFKDLTTVVFQQANACVDPLPSGDLIIIREVFQHLTNAQIEAILQNVEKTNYQAVIVAEHLPPAKELARPNIDLPAHSNLVRSLLGSGVFINEPPFSRSARQIAQFDRAGGPMGVFLLARTNGR